MSRLSWSEGKGMYRFRGQEGWPESMGWLPLPFTRLWFTAEFILQLENCYSWSPGAKTSAHVFTAGVTGCLSPPSGHWVPTAELETLQCLSLQGKSVASGVTSRRPKKPSKQVFGKASGKLIYRLTCNTSVVWWHALHSGRERVGEWLWLRNTHTGGCKCGHFHNMLCPCHKPHFKNTKIQGFPNY